MGKNLVIPHAHRTLGRLKSYKDCVGKNIDDFPQYAKLVQVGPDETIIGVYENSTGEPKESIIITDTGLYVSGAQEWVYIRYEQVTRVEFPVELKNQAEELFVYCGGVRTKLVIRGGAGKFRDIYEFLHFLERVLPNADLH